MRIATILAALPMLIVGANAAAQSQLIEQSGPFRHVGSNTTFPEQFGDFARARIVRYDDPAGEDISAGYGLAVPGARIAFTQYIYPAPAPTAGLTRERLCREEFDGSAAEIDKHDRSHKVGEPAPPFTLLTYDKHKLSLDDLRGKVVVINHWATWCGPCKAEMPMMSGFHHRFKDKGFEIFGVTTDDSVPAGQLKRLSEVLSYPLVRHFSGNYPILTGVPTSYVIDRKGVVRYAKATAFSERDFVELIIPLLNEPVPAIAAAK